MDKAKHYFLQRLCMLAVMIVAVLPLLAQEVGVSITAPREVTVGQQFRIAYLVKNNKEVKESIIIKNMDGFEILYGPSLSTSNSTTIKGGKRSELYVATTTYYLKALKKGKYTLPQGEATINGKKYKSEAFKIEVKDVAELADEIEDVDAFIRVIPSRTSVNLTDTLTLTYKLYTSRAISRIVDTDFPQVEGFYSSNITRARQYFADEEVDGKLYKVVELRKLLLQPKKIGLMTVPEGSVTVQYVAPTGRRVRDIWGDAYEETISSNKTLKMEPVTIRVQDLKAI